LRGQLGLEDKKLKTRIMPIEDLNSFWLEGDGWDITIGEDTEGNPYVSIAIAKEKKHKLTVTEPSWKGKILKIHLAQ